MSTAFVRLLAFWRDVNKFRATLAKLAPGSIRLRPIRPMHRCKFPPDRIRLRATCGPSTRPGRSGRARPGRLGTPHSGGLAMVWAGSDQMSTDLGNPVSIFTCSGHRRNLGRCRPNLVFRTRHQCVPPLTSGPRVGRISSEFGARSRPGLLRCRPDLARDAPRLLCHRPHRCELDQASTKLA